MRTLFRGGPRVYQVLSILWSYFLIPYLFPSRRKGISWPVRTRMAIEQLGAAWIKLGQLLALRFDLLPAAFCFELFKLLNNVAPVPYAQAREVIKRELGDYPENIFGKFETEPFAAASVGQVYRAWLPTGEKVAVKVQRPGIEKTFRTDIDLMYGLCWVLDRVRIFGFRSSRVVIDEFARWINDELDYMAEARHATLLHYNSQGDRLERVPKVYWQYTRKKVLTTEFLNGIPLVHIMHAKANGDKAYMDKLAAEGYDLYRIAQHIDWNMLNQMYVNGHFHADIHPANILVMPDNVIGYVDFGIIGELSDEARESLVQYNWHFFQKNAPRAVAEIMRWLKPTQWGKVDAAREELIRLHEEYRFSLEEPGPQTARDSISTFAIKMLSAIRNYGLVISPGVLAYIRTLITADTLRVELAPEHDMLRHIERFFTRMLGQQVRAALDPRRIIGFAFDYSYRVRGLLELVEGQTDTLNTLATVLVTTRRSAQTVGRITRIVVTLAALAGVVLLILRANPDLLSGRLPSQVNLDPFSIGVIVVLAIVVFVVFLQGRQERAEDKQAAQVQRTLQRQWEEPRTPGGRIAG